MSFKHLSSTTHSFFALDTSSPDLLSISQSSKPIGFLPFLQTANLPSASIASSPITSPVAPSVSVPATPTPKPQSKPSKDHRPIQAVVIAGILVAVSVVWTVVVLLCYYYRFRRICRTQGLGHSHLQIHSQYTMSLWTSDYTHETKDVEIGSEI